MAYSIAGVTDIISGLRTPITIKPLILASRKMGGRSYKNKCFYDEKLKYIEPISKVDKTPCLC